MHMYKRVKNDSTPFWMTEFGNCIGYIHAALNTQVIYVYVSRIANVRSVYGTLAIKLDS